MVPPLGCLGLFALLSMFTIAAPTGRLLVAARAAPLCNNPRSSWEEKRDAGCPICKDTDAMPSELFSKYCTSLSPSWAHDQAGGVWRREVEAAADISAKMLGNTEGDDELRRSNGHKKLSDRRLDVISRQDTGASQAFGQNAENRSDYEGKSVVPDVDAPERPLKTLDSEMIYDITGDGVPFEAVLPSPIEPTSLPLEPFPWPVLPQPILSGHPATEPDIKSTGRTSKDKKMHINKERRADGNRIAFRTSTNSVLFGSHTRDKESTDLKHIYVTHQPANDLWRRDPKAANPESSIKRDDPVSQTDDLKIGSKPVNQLEEGNGVESTSVASNSEGGLCAFCLDKRQIAANTPKLAIPTDAISLETDELRKQSVAASEATLVTDKITHQPVGHIYRRERWLKPALHDENYTAIPIKNTEKISSVDTDTMSMNIEVVHQPADGIYRRNTLPMPQSGAGDKTTSSIYLSRRGATKNEYWQPKSYVADHVVHRSAHDPYRRKHDERPSKSTDDGDFSASMSLGFQHGLVPSDTSEWKRKLSHKGMSHEGTKIVARSPLFHVPTSMIHRSKQRNAKPIPPPEFFEHHAWPSHEDVPDFALSAHNPKHNEKEAQQEVKEEGEKKHEVEQKQSDKSYKASLSSNIVRSSSENAAGFRSRRQAIQTPQGKRNVSPMLPHESNESHQRTSELSVSPYVIPDSVLKTRSAKYKNNEMEMQMEIAEKDDEKEITDKGEVSETIGNSMLNPLELPLDVQEPYTVEIGVEKRPRPQKDSAEERKAPPVTLPETLDSTNHDPSFEALNKPGTYHVAQRRDEAGFLNSIRTALGKINNECNDAEARVHTSATSVYELNCRSEPQSNIEGHTKRQNKDIYNPKEINYNEPDQYGTISLKDEAAEKMQSHESAPEHLLVRQLDSSRNIANIADALGNLAGPVITEPWDGKHNVIPAIVHVPSDRVYRRDQSPLDQSELLNRFPTVNHEPTIPPKTLFHESNGPAGANQVDFNRFLHHRDSVLSSSNEHTHDAENNHKPESRLWRYTRRFDAPLAATQTDEFVAPRLTQQADYSDVLMLEQPQEKDSTGLSGGTFIHSRRFAEPRDRNKKPDSIPPKKHDQDTDTGGGQEAWVHTPTSGVYLRDAADHGVAPIEAITHRLAQVTNRHPDSQSVKKIVRRDTDGPTEIVSAFDMKEADLRKLDLNSVPDSGDIDRSHQNGQLPWETRRDKKRSEHKEDQDTYVGTAAFRGDDTRVLLPIQIVDRSSEMNELDPQALSQAEIHEDGYQSPHNALQEMEKYTDGRLAVALTPALILHHPGSPGGSRRSVRSHQTRAESHRHAEQSNHNNEGDDEKSGKVGSTAIIHNDANLRAGGLAHKRSYDESTDSLSARNTMGYERDNIPSNGRAEIHVPWSSVEHRVPLGVQIEGIQVSPIDNANMQNAKEDGHEPEVVGSWDGKSQEEVEMVDGAGGIPVVHEPWDAVIRLPSGGEQKRSEEITAAKASSIYPRKTLSADKSAGKDHDRVKGSPVGPNTPYVHETPIRVMDDKPGLTPRILGWYEGSKKDDGKRENKERRNERERENMKSDQKREHEE
ncbi:hypothetical protein BKA66DRAFT_550185 [Pyrenochaeta sp. MPI-SDFR-AT-0127]|nr:hypothetical protein BKA66DRAFT_550185 [Pyrenochaeta sp. MPI-SDFR-AT-0127]